MDIIDFCKRYAYNEYTIMEDGRIIIHRDLHINRCGLTKLPENLTVEGNLNCSVIAQRLPEKLNCKG